METGKTVVLLNLENLYESLYDALNQVLVILIGLKCSYTSMIEVSFHAT